MHTYYTSSKDDLEIIYWQVNLDIFKNIGIAFYGYVNQFAVVTILKEIRNSNSIGFASITLRSGYPAMILYTMICFAGYVSFGKNIPEFIVLREPLQGSKDIFMTIGQLGVLITMVLGVVIRVRCNSNIIQYFLKNAGCIDKKPGDKISKKARFTIGFCLSYIPGVIAMLIKSGISNYVSLFSSLVCPYYILIAPCKSSGFLLTF
jgi:hypothetical protein